MDGKSIRSLIFMCSLEDLLQAGDVRQKTFFIAPSRNLMTAVLQHDFFLPHHNNMENDS